MASKNGRRRGASSSSLPEDIIFSEILPYLTAKSAARCRCVSHSWNYPISSRSFVELHLRRANRQPKLFFGSPSVEPSEDRYFYAWQPPGDGPAIKKLTRHNLSSPILQTNPLHGLVLIYCQYPEDQRGYYVCNPSTGVVLPLHDTKEPGKMNCQRGTAAPPDPPCYQAEAYGLGYSSATNEYKVVRLFSDEDTGAAPCCEVFVLGTPAYWRPTAQQPPLCIVDGEEPAVFLNGHLHFLSDDGAIVTLDMNDQTFGSLSSSPFIGILIR